MIRVRKKNTKQNKTLKLQNDLEIALLSKIIIIISRW